jgi:hypothetical protein
VHGRGAVQLAVHTMQRHRLQRAHVRRAVPGCTHAIQGRPTTPTLSASEYSAPVLAHEVLKDCCGCWCGEERGQVMKEGAQGSVQLCCLLLVAPRAVKLEARSRQQAALVRQEGALHAAQGLVACNRVAETRAPGGQEQLILFQSKRAINQQ